MFNDHELILIYRMTQRMQGTGASLDGMAAVRAKVKEHLGGLGRDRLEELAEEERAADTDVLAQALAKASPKEG